jgi:hypothetical protein
MAKDNRTAHLPRKHEDSTFCGLPLEEGTLLSSTIEAADCDECIRVALEEHASIVDRREQSTKSLAQILAGLLGGKVIGENAVLIGSNNPASLADLYLTCDHFRPEDADLSEVPRHIAGQMFLDLPAFVLSTEGTFPSPAAMCISMLSFYLETLRIAVRNKDVTQAHGIARAEACSKLLDWLSANRNADFANEYPLTVEEWPDEIRKAHG